jgi:hypothetical protein
MFCAPPSLVAFQDSLTVAGFRQSLVLGGPNPDQQAIGIVCGALKNLPADGYAVADLANDGQGLAGRAKLVRLPRILELDLGDRLGVVTRGIMAVFRDAATLGICTLALAIPEERVFGRLGNEIAVRTILGAAHDFWRIHPESALNRVLIAVPPGPFTLWL